MVYFWVAQLFEKKLLRQGQDGQAIIDGVVRSVTYNKTCHFLGWEMITLALRIFYGSLLLLLYLSQNFFREPLQSGLAASIIVILWLWHLDKIVVELSNSLGIVPVRLLINFPWMLQPSLWLGQCEQFGSKVHNRMHTMRKPYLERSDLDGCFMTVPLVCFCSESDNRTAHATYVQGPKWEIMIGWNTNGILMSRELWTWCKSHVRLIVLRPVNILECW